MAYYEQLSAGEITISNKTSIAGGYPTIFAGSQTTRAGVLAEVPSNCAIGSQYNSDAGKIYVKVANAAAAADWELVTTTAAD